MEGFKDETVVTEIKKLDVLTEKEPAIDILGGPAMGRQIILTNGEYVVGRSKDANVVVEDDGISRLHFKILVKDKIATIEDLNSTNGTFINGARISKQILRANDKIQISSVTVLRFSYVDLIDKNSHERFYEMALYDPVTNAYTKRFLIDRLEHEFSYAARRNLPLSFIIFDLDHFKKINDSYGHPAGDYILQKVAEITKQTVRATDLFARYGGEEFVILMRDTNEEEGITLADRLRKLIEIQEFIFEEKKIPVTISLGVACLKDGNFNTPQELLKAADEYLYISKSEGRNRVTAKASLHS